MLKVNPVQDGPFRDYSRMEGKKGPLPNFCHTNSIIKLDTVIPDLKKIQKTFKSRDTLLEFCSNQHFFTGNQQFLLYQEIQIWIAFPYIISNSLYFV